MSKLEKRVTIAGKEVRLTPPASHALRAEILGMVRTASTVRICGAALGATWRSPKPPRVAFDHCNISRYGGDVYNLLCDRGATDGELAIAGASAYELIAESKGITPTPTEEEVTEAQGNSSYGAG